MTPIELLLATPWLPLDTQIVVVGAICAMACALLGVFLVLRRMSLMGDAISHAVLPGLAIAFLVTESRGSVAMLVGAGVIGLLTALLTESIRSWGRVDEGASMGVVFTVLFAVGLILIRQFADRVDLDADCVLYGAIEFTPLDPVTVLGATVPRAALVLGGVLLVNLLFVALCYKELKISAFDPALATTLGIDARLMHYLLMTLVAVTTVAAFESVGSILVIAMLIVPPASAYLLTDRLGVMIALSLLFGAASAAIGHYAAIHAPAWIGFPDAGTSTAGMIGVAAGGIFGIALLAAPRRGLLARAWNHAALRLRIVCEDVLATLARREEAEPDALRAESLPAGRARSAPRSADRASAVAGAGRLVSRLALLDLRRRGLIERRRDRFSLTERGRAAARELLRSHRLWETYMDQHVDVPTDHVHAAAERLEHVTTAGLRDRLAESLGHPELDPQGRRIPK